jgi:hypothetical protein
VEEENFGKTMLGDGQRSARRLEKWSHSSLKPDAQVSDVCHAECVAGKSAPQTFYG